MTNLFDMAAPVAANHVPLSPVSFLNRAADVHKTRTATVYGDTRRTWADVARRVRGVAKGLQDMGIGPGIAASVIAPNIPQMLELHFAVPMTGGVLNTINTRLEPETVAYIFEHSEAKVVIADTAYRDLVEAAFAILGRSLPVVDIRDADGPAPAPFGAVDYEDLAQGPPLEGDGLPSDEWQAIALNYTSGTSGRPKGVVYHHRGAYLIAMGTSVGWAMGDAPSYLSVVPMFHCNGWGHPWMLAMIGGKGVFTRDPVPEEIFAAIEAESVTHFGGAPIVLQMLADSDAAPAQSFNPRVRVMTAGAPPPPAILERSEALGLDVMHVYGLTETYGHISQCLWQDDWAQLSPKDMAQMKSHQGVAFPMLEGLEVFDRERGTPVPRDGETQGEIAIRGNVVMKGYFKNPEATAEAFEGGWFWSGDAAVVHPNGYVQIRDRLKDVIISGGENVSSVEVEGVLYRHPDVQAAAVVAKPDETWGEVPCAFVELRAGAGTSEDDILGFCKEQLAGFKRPKSVVFGELPKTSTGKIQKFLLRKMATDG
jgi:fatty-acyl-CoA synthase